MRSSGGRVGGGGVVPRLVVLVVAGLALARPGGAQDAGAAAGFDLGVRADIVGASGEPSNDILGAGVLARWPRGERWRLGLALDHSPGFDVERPYELVGLRSAESEGEVDADGTMTSLSAWLERVHPAGRRWELFWGVGAGAARVDVDDLSGRLAGGGRYELEQDVGTELLALALVAARLRLGARWWLEGAARLEQHFTDWEVRDRVSGRRARVDDYLVRGVHLAVGRRF